MRLFAVAFAVAVLPVCASAQGLASDQALADAAFVNSAPHVAIDPGVGLRAQPGATGIFSTPDFLGESLSGQPALASGRVAAAGERLITWSTSEFSRPAGGGAVDTLRLSTASVSRTPLGAAGTSYGVYDPDAVDVTYVRGWPSAMLVQAGGLGMSVSPHAGFGVGSGGASSAEAGATVRVSSADSALRERLAAMGVKDGSSRYGDRGRFYLFAAVRGQAVGLNMMSMGPGGLRQAGWTTDQSSALVGDGQVGVGWRKGGMEADVGYVHRGVHIQNAPLGASDSYADDMAALSLTFHPHW